MVQVWDEDWSVSKWEQSNVQSTYRQDERQIHQHKGLKFSEQSDKKADNA